MPLTHLHPLSPLPRSTRAPANQSFFSLALPSSPFLCYGESQYQSIKSSLDSEGLRSRARASMHAAVQVRAGRYDRICHETEEVTFPVILLIYLCDHP